MTITEIPYSSVVAGKQDARAPLSPNPDNVIDFAAAKAALLEDCRQADARKANFAPRPYAAGRSPLAAYSLLDDLVFLFLIVGITVGLLWLIGSG